MNVLIVGGVGFVGGYLSRFLKEKGQNVFLTKIPSMDYSSDEFKVLDVDLLDRSSINNALKVSNPDVIYNLAAQSSVALSWKEPVLTVEINIIGCLNLLEEIRLLNNNPKVLLIGSSEEYGVTKDTPMPIKEDNVLLPKNIYGVTKFTQSVLGKLYVESYGMNIIMTRSFNHIGAGQLPMFVVSDFCKQVAEIEKGVKEPVINVGNLAAKRDFTSVLDVVNAYYLLSEKGKIGEIYNVGSGKAISIEYILNQVISYSDKNIKIEVDKNKFRPIDVEIVEADITKIKNDTGWQPINNIEVAIKESLDYWRKTV